MYGFLRVWVARYVGAPVRRTLRSEVQSSSSSRSAAAMLSGVGSAASSSGGL